MSGGDRIFTPLGPLVRSRTAACEVTRANAPNQYLLRLRAATDTGAFLAVVGKLGMATNMRPRGRVLVVDDDPLICDLVASTLSEHGYPTRRASDAREALYLVQRETPDVILLDVHLPDISGYQLCRRLRDDFGDSLGIIVISGERKESFDRVAGMLLGADDYMVKPFVLDELLARVQRLAKRSRPVARTAVAGLTRRELEILRLLACGMDHMEIARDLVITAKTVEKHIEHILLKLGVHSRAQAIALALQQEPEPVDQPNVVSLTPLDGGRREAVN